MSKNVASQAAVAQKDRAFRGLAAVFFLSFLNLLGVGLTITAMGGLGEWSRWQFVGLFGLLEAAAGFSNILAPNIWRLPIAELETSRRTSVKLAASAMLIPHWGGAARAAAGLTLLIAAGILEGLAPSSLAIIPVLAALVLMYIAINAIVARLGVKYASIDVLQVVIRWRSQENALPPLSLSASVQQFLLGIITLPAIKLLAPGALYGPELRPSLEMLLVVVVVTLALIGATFALWAGRIDWQAPREQQREAELNA